jgi:predicted kinase
MTSSSGPSISKPVLVVFGGLPGTGKSGIALGLAARMSAVYLRIDTIEQAIRNSPGVRQATNEEGYRVAYALAEDNLRLGKAAISESFVPTLLLTVCV